MLWAPVAVALALRCPLLVLIVSVGLYAAARAFGVNLPNWPEPGGWFFNPIAWQLVFTLGVVAAIVWRDGFSRPAPWLVLLSAVTVGGAAMIVTNEGGLGNAFQSLGLNSLSVFAAGSFLSACSQAALAATSSHTSAGVERVVGL